MNGKRRVGLLITSLLCITGLSAASATSALGDITTNPDGSHTATVTFPNPPGFPCPSTFNGTTSTSLSVFVPRGAQIVSHVLTFNPPCPGSGVTDSFNPDASDPPPAADDQTTRDDFIVTCQQMGGCAGGSVSVTLEVTYFDPLTSLLPPAENQITAPQKVKVKKNEAKFRVYYLDWVGDAAASRDLDLTDAVMVALGGALQQREVFAAKRARPVNVATAPDAHVSKGQSTLVSFRLNARGRKAIAARGSLTVTLHMTLRSAGGSAPYAARMKLVKK